MSGKLRVALGGVATPHEREAERRNHASERPMDSWRVAAATVDGVQRRAESAGPGQQLRRRIVQVERREAGGQRYEGRGTRAAGRTRGRQAAPPARHARHWLQPAADQGLRRRRRRRRRTTTRSEERGARREEDEEDGGEGGDDEEEEDEEDEEEDEEEDDEEERGARSEEQ